ncbi:MAG: hypothetical protein ABJH06_01730 [Paraglaciecola sp.]|uniref:hypothetical protein n=1 Tax=Paraglaciecola sp. TaxID=1920173 RepID=UPI0032995838
MSDESSKRKSCELANALLTSNEDYLDIVLALSYLGNEIHGQCWDTEFHTFGLIASETDHLPLKKKLGYVVAKNSYLNRKGKPKKLSIIIQRKCTLLAVKYWRNMATYNKNINWKITRCRSVFSSYIKRYAFG